MSTLVTTSSDNSQSNSKRTNVFTFTKEEEAQISYFIPKINVLDSNFVLEYGANIQNLISSHSNELIDFISKLPSNPEIGIMVEELSSIMCNLNHNFSSKRNPTKFNYAEILDKISTLTGMLYDQQLKLMQFSDKLCDLEKSFTMYYRWLHMHITAGERKLKLLRENGLSRLKEIAYDNAVLSEKYNALINACSRFEERLSSLRLSVSVVMLLIAQMHLMKTSVDKSLSKLKKITAEVIPNWKKQIKLSNGISNLSKLKITHSKLIHWLSRFINSDCSKSSTISMIQTIKCYKDIAQKTELEINMQTKALKHIINHE